MNNKYPFVVFLLMFTFFVQTIVAQNDIFIDSVVLNKKEFYNGEDVKCKIKFNYTGTFAPATEFRITTILSPTSNYKLADTLFYNGYSYQSFNDIQFVRNWTVNISYKLDSGIYYLIFIADSDSKMAESNENNNELIIPVHVSKTLGDCSVKSVESTYFIANSYNTIPANFVFEGKTNFPAPPTNWYFSEDSILDINDAYFYCKESFGGQMSMDLKLNKKIKEGYYYLFVEIDPQHQLEELNEKNNLYFHPKQVYVYDTVHPMELNNASTLCSCNAIIEDNGGLYGFYWNSHSEMDILPNDTSYLVRVELVDPIFLNSDMCSVTALSPFNNSYSYISDKKDGKVSVQFFQRGNYTLSPCMEGVPLDYGYYNLAPSFFNYRIRSTCVHKSNLKIKDYSINNRKYPLYFTDRNLTFSHLYKNEGFIPNLPSKGNIYLSNSYEIKDSIAKLATYTIDPLKAGDTIRYFSNATLPEFVQYDKTYYLVSTYFDREGNEIRYYGIDFKMVHIPVAGTATTADSIICYNTKALLNLSDFNGYILWQESTDGINGWINVNSGTGSTSSVYTTANLLTGKYYRAKVGKYGIPDIAYSNIIHITVNPQYQIYDTIIVCSGASHTFPDGFTQYDIISPFSHKSVLVSSGGCDSIIETTVNIKKLNTHVTLQSNRLTADTAGLSYQWFDCIRKVKLADGSNQSYLALENGSYAVIISDGVCTDTSYCYDFTYVGDAGLNNRHFKLYPNPTAGKIIIEGDNLIQISITDLKGLLIMEEKIMGENKVEMDLSNLEKGVYIVRVATSNEMIHQKIIIK